MTAPATRLLTLIQLLQRRPAQKASELAAELGISIRTIHRYLEKLDEMGIPLVSERGPYGGFSLVRGYRLPPLIFHPDEAAALALGAGLVSDLWGPLYQEPAASALVKLDNVLPDEQRREVAWARRTLVTAGLRRPDLDETAPVLERLRQAARDHHQVRLSYRGSRQAQAQSRLLDPYALLHRWGWWYVVGYCHLRQAIRSFRLDRIESIEPVETLFDRPAAFDAQAFVQAQPQGGDGIQVRLRFAAEFAGIARSSRSSWESLVEQQDGSVEVSFHAPDLNWAASTTLVYGPSAVVLEPPDLKERIAEWVQALAKIYLSTGS
jgi:predicted DNA-binding transcriptional regulator YafY